MRADSCGGARMFLAAETHLRGVWDDFGAKTLPNRLESIEISPCRTHGNIVDFTIIGIIPVRIFQVFRTSRRQKSDHAKTKLLNKIFPIGILVLSYLRRVLASKPSRNARNHSNIFELDPSTSAGTRLGPQPVYGDNHSKPWILVNFR